MDCGYAVEQKVLSDMECDSLLHALTLPTVQRSRAGARHLMTNPAVARLANDDRLVSIAGNALGSAPIPFRATLFEKTSRTNWLIPWHQDTALPIASVFDAAGWGPWPQKAGIHYAHAPA